MKPTEQQLDQFVRQNVNLCVSSLVATLANGWDGGCAAIESDGAKELASLSEQASELCYPLDDYEEAARQAGWTLASPTPWFRKATPAEIEEYGEGDGLCHAVSAEAACEHDQLDPYQWEIFEHWAVSGWLAEKLEAKGERIDRDFAGLCVWGRTCTGQSISMDGVIVEICAEALS